MYCSLISPDCSPKFDVKSQRSALVSIQDLQNLSKALCKVSTKLSSRTVQDLVQGDAKNLRCIFAGLLNDEV
jgi:inorganic pyrophosphatase/exopolyphosphatase